MRQKIARLFLTVAVFTVVAMLAGMVIGCGGWTPPGPPTNPCDQCSPEEECIDGQCVVPVPPLPVPPDAEQCHQMQPPAQAQCYDNPPDGQSFEQWAPNWGYVCALPEGGTSRVAVPADCPVAPELPQPQCKTFVNRGSQVMVVVAEACDCYIGHELQPPCSTEPPPGEKCSFPQGVPNDEFVKGPVLTEHAAAVNAAMKGITGCSVGTDCVTGMTPDDWMHAVIEKLQDIGLCAGRHIDTTPGGTDEIAVSERCVQPWEGYKIYNYGGGKVIWSPGANRPSWSIPSSYCSGTTPPPIDPPPTGDCPAPHPDTTRMKFKTDEKGSHMDTTWVTIGQPAYCAEIGMGCMPGTGGPGNPPCVPRAGCPVRQEGNDERATCEAELCDQKWECNDQPHPPWRGNPAQTNCQGWWKTWCSAPNSTAVLEGER